MKPRIRYSWKTGKWEPGSYHDYVVTYDVFQTCEDIARAVNRAIATKRMLATRPTLRPEVWK